jgi:hypothetical protein
MPWNAIDSLDDARGATQSLLWPIEWGRWLRLALIVLFVGGSSGTIPSGGNFNFGGDVPVGPPADGRGPTVPIDGGVTLPNLAIPDAVVLGALVLLALAILVVLALAVVGPVMEFVLVEGLRTRTVRIRRPFRRYLGAGLQLFLFRLAVVLLLAGVVVVPVAAVAFAGMAVSPAFLAFALPLVVLFLALALVAAVVMRLTTDFVVPAMIAEDRGVLDGWRRVFPLFRREWREFGLYLVVRFVLGIAVGIAAGLVVGLLALLVALPFLLVGGALFFALTGGGAGALGALGIGLLAVVAAAYLLVLIVVSLFVQVPVVTFFRYYALLFLGSEEPELDLVAGVRDADATTE